MNRRPPPAPALKPEERKGLEALRTGREPLVRASDHLFQLACQHKVAASLAAIASEQGQEVPEMWRGRLRQLRAQQMTLRPRLDGLAEELNRLGRPWFAAISPRAPLRPLLMARR